eukprot:5892200-Amphidinium_carterae.1
MYGNMRRDIMSFLSECPYSNQQTPYFRDFDQIDRSGCLPSITMIMLFRGTIISLQRQFAL